MSMAMAIVRSSEAKGPTCAPSFNPSILAYTTALAVVRNALIDYHDLPDEIDAISVAILSRMMGAGLVIEVGKEPA